MSWLDDHRDMALSLLNLTVRAPSSHNSQPWVFRFNSESVELLADRTRALPVNDPDDRELVVSCGAALFHLRIAALHLGLTAKTTLLPDESDPDLLARVELATAAQAPGPVADLVKAIPRRFTCRQRFTAEPVPAAVLAELAHAAREEWGELVVLASEAARRDAAALIAEGDAMLWANPSWRRELAAWMHPRRRGDGLVVPGLAWPVAQWVVRSFDMGGGVAAKDQQLAEHSPVLALLTTVANRPRCWLEAGQALARVLLTACSFGLQASYLNQPVQVAVLRPRLTGLAGAGVPQVLLRIGYPEAEQPASPRRAVEEVVEWDEGLVRPAS